MLCIKATLIAGANHAKYPAGERVAAVLFAEADGIEAAEDRIAPELQAQGWATIVTERYKDVASAEDVSDALLKEAFQEAVGSGVGYVLFPGQGPN
jgi:hypothetical protein